MCLIIHTTPEFSISQDLMANFAARNNDGFGMMWIQDNRLCHMKFGPDKMGDLYAMYESIKAYEGFIHLRMRTHGHTNQEMAHPFNCGYGIYLMHNGVLADSTGEDKSKSDTWYFVNNILSPLFKNSKNPHKLIRSIAFSDLLHKYLGYNNRVVIGDRGGYMIYNEKAWYTIKEEATGCKGMLVSNTYAWNEEKYKPAKPRYNYGHQYTGPYTGYNNHKIIDVEEDENPFGQEKSTVPSKSADKKVVPSLFTLPGPSPEAVEAFLKEHFYQLRKYWYADAYGKVYRKRPDNGLERHSEMDDNDGFWDSLPDELIQAYGEWIGHVQNLDLDTTKVAPTASSRKRKKVEPKASQLILNWTNQSPDQIKEDFKTYPDRAAEAIVALTHEPLHQELN